MNKLISTFNEQYDSLIESVTELNGNFIIRTVDDRFFKFGIESIDLLNALKSNIAVDEHLENKLELFINNVLLPKGLYQLQGTKKNYLPKKPKLTLHVELFSSSFVTKICSFFMWMFTPFVVCSFVISSLLINIRYFGQHSYVFSYEYIFSYTPSEIIFVLCLSIITSLFHELGHATCCKKLSERAGDIGFGVNLFIPVFYANVSNVHLLSSNQKAAIAISGVYFQLILATSLIFLIPIFPEIEKYIVLNLIGMLFNSIPFFRNDGYWLLNDLLKKEDLLKETIIRLKSFKNIQTIHVIYGTLIIIFFTVAILLMFNFAINKGPSIITEIVNHQSRNFSFYLKAVLVAFHYIVITISVWMLLNSIYKKITQKLKLTTTKAS